MSQHKRLISVLAGLFATLMAVGISWSGPQQPPSANAIPHPLQSTLPNPTQLATCTNQAIEYTKYAHPSDQPISVWLARQVTDAQFAAIAPEASRGLHFGVLMNLVILKGSFQHPRSNAHMPYILYVLMPYPDCSPTFTTFQVKDFGLSNLANR